MSKKDLKIKNAIHNEAQHARRKDFQGIGYYAPSDKELRRLKQLYKTWNTKLQKLGQSQQEYLDSNGHSHVFFVDDHSTGIYKQENYTAEYFFSLMQTFANFCSDSPAFKKVFSDNPEFHMLVLRAYADGITLHNIVELAKTLEFYRHPETGTLLRACFNKNKRRSKYYIYIKLRRTLQLCWLWHALDHNGELALTDLPMYNFLGLDIPGTLELLQSFDPSITKLNVKPISLYANDKSLTADEVLSCIVPRT